MEFYPSACAGYYSEVCSEFRWGMFVTANDWSETMVGKHEMTCYKEHTLDLWPQTLCPQRHQDHTLDLSLGW